MNLFKSFRFLNLYWLFSDKLIRIPFTILISSLMARYLGPADLGLIVFAVSFFGIFGFLINSGIEEIITRNLVQEPENAESILAMGLLLKFCGGLIATIVALPIGYYFFTFDEFLLIVIVASSGLFYGPFILESYFNSRYESKFIVRVGLVIFLFSSFLKLIGIFFKLNLYYFGFLVPLEILLISIAYLYLGFSKTVPLKKTKVNKVILIDVLRDSYPLIISGFAVTFYMKMDQIMIKSMLGNVDLGIFSVGIRFVENLYFVPMLITSSFLPMLVEEKSKSIQDLDRATYMLTSSTLFICMLISGSFYIFSDTFINFFFGMEYLKAIPILKVYAFTLVFTALGVSSSRRLLVENRQNLSLFRTISGLLINLILNFLWIPKYGSIGAAWASVISNAFASFLFYGFIPSTWSIFKLQCSSFNPVPLIRYYKNLNLK
ncbi:flippase [Leptospira yanagawae]|uniref:Flippase n=1 Tax=Leptospira yanagawae TaxID=293069 RepID=A0ABY2LWS2_9LEPT|nr:flippase [Leptospira yanagawae]TGL16505.1 flippase [Leptospira yanagawae]